MAFKASPGTRIAIVRSSYYEEFLSRMEASARSSLSEGGIREENIRTIVVPGSFEIPLLCQYVLERKEVDGIVALGVIIQGETFHASEIARACTDALMQLQLQHRIPIVHAVLYCKTFEQAQERCLGQRNKGEEAARTLLRMLTLLHQ